MVDFIDTRKNFSDAQKLSRWQFHHETWAFLTLVTKICLTWLTRVDIYPDVLFHRVSSYLIRMSVILVILLVAVVRLHKAKMREGIIFGPERTWRDSIRFRILLTYMSHMVNLVNALVVDSISCWPIKFLANCNMLDRCVLEVLPEKMQKLRKITFHRMQNKYIYSVGFWQGWRSNNRGRR